MTFLPGPSSAQSRTVIEGVTSIQLPDTSAYSATQRQVLRLERRRSAAIAAHDTAWLATLYARGFSAIAGNGRRIDRQQLFTVFAGDTGSTRFRIDELEVAQLATEVARVTGRLTTLGIDGTPVAASRYTHLYVRKEDHWWLMSAQATATQNP